MLESSCEIMQDRFRLSLGLNGSGDKLKIGGRFRLLKLFRQDKYDEVSTNLGEI